MIFKIKNIEKVNLIVIANPKNNPEYSNIKVEGMDYTLRIKLENLQRIYVNDILNRVRAYNERMVVVVEGSDCNDADLAFENIFGFTGSKTLKTLIKSSDISYYDGTLIRDKYNVCER